MRSTMTKSKKRWAIIASVAGGALLIPAVAFAAVLLFGFGTFSADASAPTPLTVDNVSLTKTLAPGQTVGAKGIVHNPNDFPVTVTSVIVQDSSVAVSGAGCQISSLSLHGTPGVTYPGAGGGTGHRQAISAATEIPAGGAEWVTVPASVSQAAGADAMCGVSAKFAVQAQVGS